MAKSSEEKKLSLKETVERIESDCADVKEFMEVDQYNKMRCFLYQQMLRQMIVNDVKSIMDTLDKCIKEYERGEKQWIITG